MLSFIILLMISPDAGPTLRVFGNGRDTAQQLGMLALAAGLCTMAACIWSPSKGKSWMLVMNGLATSGLGLLLTRGATRPVAFRTIAVLIVVMAVSIGVYELSTARTWRAHLPEEWMLAGAGVVSVGFAAVFLGFVLGWIRLEPSPSAQTFHWLGSYFGFSAICMLGLALGHLRSRPDIHRLDNGALPTA